MDFSSTLSIKSLALINLTEEGWRDGLVLMLHTEPMSAVSHWIGCAIQRVFSTQELSAAVAVAVCDCGFTYVLEIEEV